MATTTDGASQGHGPSGSDDDGETRRVETPELPVATATPSRLGRYLVVAQLGAGGMGEVFRAYDPKLRREVALKLLRRVSGGSQGSEQIVREARAMARLSHPNLVPVYDVEEEDGAAFIAMEYVEGDTLHSWLRRTPRRWPQIVAAFIGAGRGLAAAHAAGVVHRDFKPTNVMVGEDGRARVMDFGIAHSGADDLDGAAVGQLASTSHSGSETVGTPPYMAPEQHAGTEVNDAADQYAFCVALYEALFDVRPFAGTDLRSLEAAKRKGEPRAPAATAQRIPGWLRTAVLRGLAVEPGDRWPTMNVLLAVLERGQARARARQLWFAAGAVASLAALGWFAHRLVLSQRTAACERTAETIAEVWNDGARTRLHDALASDGHAYAITTAQKVMPWIDAHAEAWRRARADACIDAEVLDRADASTTERTLWCLDERRMAFAALIAELSRADASVVPRALQAVASLGGIEACRDTAALARLPPPPPQDQRAAVADVVADLARAGALQRAGRHAEGLELARSILARTDGLEWPPLLAAAHEREAQLLESLGDYKQAEQIATTAYFEAADSGAWDVASRAATRLTYIVGERLVRVDEGLEWAQHARIALAQSGDPGGQGEADRLAVSSAVHLRNGEYAEARRTAEGALGISEAALGREHPIVGLRLVAVASAMQGTGEYEPAKELLERALQIEEATLGVDHPDLATSLSTLAQVDYVTGDFAGAQARCERALALLEAALGPDHPRVASAINNLALVLQSVGQTARAREAHERAQAIWEKAFGPDHPDIQMSLANLALIYASEGDFQRAEQIHERVSASLERTLGPDHPELAQSLVHRAINLAGMDRRDVALPLLERALKIFEHHDGMQPEELMCMFLLAKTLVATGGDRERARALAVRARDERRAKDSARQDLEEIEAWLAELDRSPSR